jgi:hypothetical protein
MSDVAIAAGLVLAACSAKQPAATQTPSSTNPGHAVDVALMDALGVEGGEWSPEREYRFASADRGLQLIAIVTTEVGTTNAANAAFLTEVDARLNKREACK